MQTILITTFALMIPIVAYASTADMHWCSKCKSTGSTEYGMSSQKGKKTLRNPRGVYYTHGGCVQN
jgi:hypothetical protein